MENLQKQKIELAIQEKEVEVREFFVGLPRITYYAVLFFLILTIPVYFLSKFASNKITSNALAKTAVTAHPAVFSSLPVMILETKVLTMLGNSYAAYALVKNPNDLVTGNLKYTFSFVDAGDNEIAEVTDSTYMLGGEQKYIIIPQVTLAKQPTGVRVNIPDPVWKKRSALISLPNVIIQSGIPQYGDQTSPDGFFVKGTVQNTSPYTLGNVRINAIVFDKFHKVIGVSQYTTNTFRPKEARDYKMFWPIPLSGSVGSAPQIIVETNILDLNNLK